ncbi:MAG: CTP synthase [Deltaproteobacteria bacterium]|nr:CTP synthase [Deltaproteobacteria bacterium]
MRSKLIFITGGVLSALGKGLSGAALGALLESRGLKVVNVKMDPYINVDPGTMSPIQHGEVFVTDDGAETDLDLGHYERFTSTRMRQAYNFTTGSVYQAVIEDERRGAYLGRTVQVIPHITDEIKRRILAAVGGFDVAIIEVGGTVGDIEALPFLEAIRQLRTDVGPEHVLFIHLTLVPYIATAGELKTKPTQHSVRELNQVGIQPDMIFCRSDRPVPRDVKRKIGAFCNTSERDVISLEDVAHIYELPLKLHEQGVDERVFERLGMWAPSPVLDAWEELVARLHNPHGVVRIGVVGKYVDFTDTYKSLYEALTHGGVASGVRVEKVLVDSETLNTPEAVEAALRGVDGVLVPGGFGARGTEGKIRAIQWAREERIPFFGICLGMQLAVVEFARDALGLVGANSTEFDADTPHPVIALLDEQEGVEAKGGTMRLGAFPALLAEGSRAARSYGAVAVEERHRHRYELNPAFKAALEAGGLRITGSSPDGALAEVVEVEDHPWFLGCQYHPEFKSRPLEPHPLFVSFIRAALECQRSR